MCAAGWKQPATNDFDEIVLKLSLVPGQLMHESEKTSRYCHRGLMIHIIFIVML